MGLITLVHGTNHASRPPLDDAIPALCGQFYNSYNSVLIFHTFI